MPAGSTRQLALAGGPSAVSELKEGRLKDAVKQIVDLEQELEAVRKQQQQQALPPSSSVPTAREMEMDKELQGIHQKMSQSPAKPTGAANAADVLSELQSEIELFERVLLLCVGCVS